MDEALKALGMLESMLQWLLQSAQAGSASNAETGYRAAQQDGDAAAAAGTSEAEPTPEVRLGGSNDVRRLQCSSFLQGMRRADPRS